MPDRLPSEKRLPEKRSSDQLEFKVESFTRDEWERRKIRTGRHWQTLRLRVGSKVLQISFPLFVAGVAILAYVFLAQSAPHVHGVPVVGSRILLVLDSSGSMGSESAEVNRQIATLRNSLSPNVSTVDGFGTISTGADNLRTALEQRLSQPRTFDAVYVLSDFYPIDKPIDCDDAAGLERVRQLVRSSGVRVYLSTVRMMPSPALLALARESGGGLIGVQLPQNNRVQQAAVCGAN
jgi:hypothetical protein